MVKLWVVLLCLTLFNLTNSRKNHKKRSTVLINQSRGTIIKNRDYSGVNVTTTGDSEKMEEIYLKLKAAEALRFMLGLKIPKKNQFANKKPPKYMVDLYKAITDQESKTKPSDMVIADTVRSIPNVDPQCPEFCHFSLHQLRSDEKMIDAELHVFINKPQRVSREASYNIKIFTISKDQEEGSPIASRRIPFNKHGWEIFPLLAPVRILMEKKSESLNISIKRTRYKGDLIEENFIETEKQPIVITFCKDYDVPEAYIISNIDFPNLFPNLPKTIFNQGWKLRHKRNIEANKTNEKFSINKQKKQELNHAKKQADESIKQNKSIDFNNNKAVKTVKSSGNHDTIRFSTFSVLSDPASPTRSCSRYPLHINFREMGWSDQIIYPSGYNAYHCKGECSFPLNKRLRSSNHAAVQSIMHVFGFGEQEVDQPCCVPNVLYDLSMLYYDENGFVVLRNYKDMVAGSCSCS